MRFFFLGDAYHTAGNRPSTDVGPVYTEPKRATGVYLRAQTWEAPGVKAAFVWVLCGLAGCTGRGVTFNKDIAPIFFSNCAACHRPGEAAPFSLLTYRDVKARATQIAAVTRNRYMPPWLPEPGYGEFEGERRLTDAQIRTIQEWVERGAPEGAARDLPAAPGFTEGWQLGTPDAILEMPAAYALRAEGTDVFRNFAIPVAVTGTRYVKAVEIRPGNKRVVHHANVLVDRTGSSRRLRAQDGELGFDGMSVQIESGVFDPDSHFLFWKPGTVPYVEPEGLAWRLESGTDLVLNMHLQPSGKPESIQPVIGLYFTDKPTSKYSMLIQLDRDEALDIPPGEKEFAVSDEFTLPLDVDVLAVYPHAHYLGKDLQGYATLPDGSKKWLIRIKQWNLNWQAVYRYSTPVFLPKGTVISMRYTYDNSAENIRNPNSPPQRVRAGNRAADEMSHLWLQVLPRGTQDGRPILQAALMARRLEKDPKDFSARFNLGALLQSEGKLAGAEAHYRAALAAKPGDYTVLNSLGTILQSQGKLSDAIAHYRSALRTRDDYIDARYNLANALAEKGELDQAAAAYRIVVRVNPDDRAARERLCTVLQSLGGAAASSGKLPDAVRFFSELVQLRPEDAAAHNNLGALFARQGRREDAAAEFRAALKIDPNLSAARSNLELVIR